MNKAISTLKEIDREIQRLAHISALLSWDQETYMPPQAVEDRSEQLAIVEGILHDRITSEETGRCLEALGVDADNPSGPDTLEEAHRAYVRELHRRYRRRTKLSRELVTELAKQTTLAHKTWVAAREQSRFSVFSPNLKIVLGLVCEMADCLGWVDHRYDPLLDEYEPWMKTAEVQDVFDSFRPRLVDLLGRIMERGKENDPSFLHRDFDKDKQRRFSRTVLESIGYDFERGRIDESAHPFTTTLGGSDVRLTTRYNEKQFNSGIFGTIHEAGHGFYEQGISADLLSTVLADGTSLGIHESQSRMWENMIGRSLPFWEYFYPKLQQQFPESLRDVDLERFYRGINAVQPSLIRVEADEVTYNLHILLRFNLERRLVSGDLEVDDLPAVWNEESKQLLGIVPENDSEGVLQDIHWSFGGFGYFSTYTLGNLYSAQIFSTMQQELPVLEEDIRRGEFAAIRGWLQESIHRWGRTYPAGTLCERVTGERLNPDYFLNYLEHKFSAIYGL